jgi:hypothetical protein
MNNEADNLREALWRGKLSDAERTRLRAQPELALEARLTEALAQLAKVPVPSNFTARVLQAVELEEKRGERRHWSWGWRSWLPRFATAAVLAFLAGWGFYHYEAGARREALVKNVAQVAASHPVPSVEALENLDAIQRMSQSAHADGDLLAALQ